MEQQNESFLFPFLILSECTLSRNNYITAINEHYDELKCRNVNFSVFFLLLLFFAYCVLQALWIATARATMARAHFYLLCGMLQIMQPAFGDAVHERCILTCGLPDCNEQTNKPIQKRHTHMHMDVCRFMYKCIYRNYL